MDPAKECLNTIDAGPPISSVAALPATETSTSFTVTWAGADDVGGSGIAAFDVFVSDNGGPFLPFVTGTRDTSASFSGEFGHTYGFYSIAVDNVGQQESQTPAADTVTLLEQLPSASLSTPSSPASGDVSIDYILTDAESDTCSILAEFSSDGGATWSTATEVSGQGDGTTDLASSPSGVSHTFAWASGNDIVNTNISNVKFRITPSDANGTGTAGTTDAFTINNSATNPGPIISSIVVVAAKGLMTWNAQDSDGVASTALTVDGVVVSKIFGPYAATLGVNYAGVFGSLPAGSHDYVITATDTLGNASQQTGSFDVVAAGPIISSIVVVAAKGLMTWNAQDSDGVASTALTVDGVVVSKIFGPYAATLGVNYAGVFGSLPAGSHDYVITATDTLGNASQQNRLIRRGRGRAHNLFRGCGGGKRPDDLERTGRRRCGEHRADGGWGGRVEDLWPLCRPVRRELRRDIWQARRRQPRLRDYRHRHARQCIAAEPAHSTWSRPGP